ncbi:hypothetical protein TPR58_11570 [Sphingomonas sp. HF-S3]|uniref:Uncharacterized protein n=1 Tax=Sphingomonas rustica TaxID=3103142 RepID=A0ABV0B9Z9_9SPHN
MLQWQVPAMISARVVMAAAIRTLYASLMTSTLFTIVCDYAGGTYISQVRASDQENAITAWAALLRREQPIEGVSDQIARDADERERNIVPLEGLSGVWCWTTLAEDELVLVNVIRSAQP